MKKISLIMPCFNEELNIKAMYDLCEEVLAKGYGYEYIFVNDGSRDNTFSVIESLTKIQTNNKIIGLDFSRNFGKESAIYAGLNYSTGDYVVVIDSDLQQHPMYVNKMVSILEDNEEYDMVCAYQEERKESWLLTKFKSAFYILINKISETKFEKNASDFRVFRKKVKEAILEIKEYNRFSKGIFSWVGYNTKYIPYEVNTRINGTTSWSFLSLFRYAIDGFVSYSTIPLKLSTYFGFITSFGSFAYLVFIVFQKFYKGIEVPGYATIVIIMLFFFGMIMISLGIIGEYLSKMYMEIKSRPIFLLDKIIENNINQDE